MDHPDYFVVNPLQIKLSLYPYSLCEENQYKNEKINKKLNKKLNKKINKKIKYNKPSKYKTNPIIQKRFNEKLNEIKEIALLLDKVKQSINTDKSLLDRY